MSLFSSPHCLCSSLGDFFAREIQTSTDKAVLQFKQYVKLMFSNYSNSPKGALAASSLNSGLDGPSNSRGSSSMAPPSFQLKAGRGSPLSKSITPEEVEEEGFTAPFRDGRAATSYEIHVYVNQPGEGGDMDVFEGNGITSIVDPGHSFLRLVRHNADGTTVDKTIGFYPEGHVNKPTKKGESVAPGGLRDDTNAEYDVSISETIDESGFNNILDYIDANKEAEYNLDEYNCTDFVIQAARAGGFYLPDSKGYWPGGGGSNPGHLGEGVRDLLEERKAP